MSETIVFGASGQLGQCLKYVAAQKAITWMHFPDRAEADILNKEACQTLFEKYRPAYVINCAAYTAVDKAEDDYDNAFNINKTGPENLAELCASYGATLIHISTDFVFKGNKSRPLNEEDPTEPIGIYGKTKLAGEKVIEDTLKKYFIIRTGWLYSEFAGNFVKTMLRFGAERDELKIIADQVGTPTYAIDLAAVVIKLIESQSVAYGIYHFSNEGVTSWFDFARATFDISGTQVKAIPVKTEEYVTKATRPPYSVLDKTKIKKELNIEISYWRDSLITCINKLK